MTKRHFSESRKADKKSRVVIATLGSYGDINPYLGLALGLRARGHEPVIATSSFYRQYIEREGIAFHPVRPDIHTGHT